MKPLGACQEPDVDPDDWFIDRSGKQYPDEDYLTDAEVARVAKTVLARSDETTEEHRDRVDGAVAAAVRTRKRQMLARRRQAKAGCYECPIRAACLEKWIDNRFMFGTWAGYFEEELRQIDRRLPLTTTP